MPGSYQFTPDTWPMIAAAGASAVIAAFAWRRRGLPVALPLAVLAAVTLMWGVASAFEAGAQDIGGKLFWHKTERVCQLLAATGTLWFALDYANLGRWLTRWMFVVLAGFPAAFVLLMATNHRHGAIWRGFSLNGNDLRPLFAVGEWLFVDYEMLLSVAAAVVFIWLFARSSLHRRSAALCLAGLLATRLTYVLQAVAEVHPWGAVDLPAAVASCNVLLYALMLFGFRTRQLIPVAYETVINQMHEGVVVLDGSHRVIEMNSAAARIVDVPVERARGEDVLRTPLFKALEPWLVAPAAGSRELRTGTGETARWYLVSRSPLDASSRVQGHLVLLRDITEARRTRVKDMEQQCALASLRERALLARELHDNLGQVLGFVKMQAQAARDLLARGQLASADGCIARLAAATQDAHVGIREYIEGAAGTAPAVGPLRDSLARYVDRFRESSGLSVELNVPNGRHPVHARRGHRNRRPCSYQERVVRILLADDHPLFAEGLRTLLEVHGFQVLGVALDGGAAVERTRALQPDLVLLDVHMPNVDGLAALRVLTTELPHIKVVMLTMSATDEELFQAIDAGASGYLLKSLDIEQFFARLDEIARGEVVLAPGLAGRILREFNRRASTAPPMNGHSAPQSLSPRELEVLALVAQGLTYKEVGATLFLSERTIKYHMGEIIARLHLENRAQAVAYAKRAGMVS